MDFSLKLSNGLSVASSNEVSLLRVLACIILPRPGRPARHTPRPSGRRRRTGPRGGAAWWPGRIMIIVTNDDYLDLLGYLSASELSLCEIGRIKETKRVSLYKQIDPCCVA